MKKLFVFGLLLCIIISFSGCSQSYEINDLSQTVSIKIRVHSISDNSYTEYDISNKEIVQEICDLFSSLVTEKYKTDKELGCFYTIRFLNRNGVEIENVMVISNVHNAIWVNSNNKVYKITSDIEIVERVEEILTAYGEVIE